MWCKALYSMYDETLVLCDVSQIKESEPAQRAGGAKVRMKFSHHCCPWLMSNQLDQTYWRYCVSTVILLDLFRNNNNE